MPRRASGGRNPFANFEEICERVYCALIRRGLKKYSLVFFKLNKNKKPTNS